MTSPAILDPRAAWLARRREMVTASDCAAILGADPRRSAFAVWAEKVGHVETEEDEEMIRGRDFEEAIARAYGRQTGRAILAPSDPFEITVHPHIPWLGCTLDRLTYRDVASMAVPLQLKKADGSRRAWAEEPPLGYQIQVMVEAACCSASWGALAAYIGPGPLQVYDLERNDEFLRKAVPMLEAFRARVLRKEPPEADGLASTSAALRALFPEENGETVELDGEALAIVEEWEAAQLLAEAEVERVKAAKNRLRARMGSASFARLTDGSYLVLRDVRRKPYQVEAAEYRVLSRQFPRMRRR